MTNIVTLTSGLLNTFKKGYITICQEAVKSYNYLKNITRIDEIDTGSLQC
jgi:hypothetical protein